MVSQKYVFVPKTGQNGTFVLKMRDICPFFTGHLSGHSSLEIELEYRVRDRDIIIVARSSNLLRSISSKPEAENFKDDDYLSVIPEY